MPDHVHLLLDGLSEQADLRRLVASWKQTTGYFHRRGTGQTLWVSGYYDRVLRDGESTMEAVRYVMMNPIRAGLARHVGDYPFAGSDVFGNQELQEVLKDCR
jgi:putative transposase